MSQRLQSIFFFLSALLFALMFFSPLVDFGLDQNILVFNVFGFESRTPGGEVPFNKLFALPVLVLTLTVILLGGYVAMGLFRAVKLVQFQRLLKIAHVNIIVIVAWIAAFFGYVYYIIPTALNDSTLVSPVFRWPTFLPLVALILTIIATIGLKKDIKKVRSTDRIR